LSGFRKFSRTAVEVSIGRTLNVDATMEVGAMTENITVEGTPNVDVTRTNLATNLDTSQLQGVPTARDVWAILQNMAPQVVLDREDVGGSEGGLQAVFSTHGSTWHQNTYALNGVNVTDPSATGRAASISTTTASRTCRFQPRSTRRTSAHPASISTGHQERDRQVHGGSAYYFENNSTVGDNRRRR
jgi:hypothetical protein